MQTVLSADPTRALADINLPLCEIAETAELMANRDAVQRQIDSSPVTEAVRDLCRTGAEVGEVISAVKWVRAVNRSDAPPQLRSKLVSSNAPEERARLRKMADRGAQLRDRYTNLVASLSLKFGIGALDSLSPGELAQKCDALISHTDELTDFLAIRRHRRF